MATVKKTPGKDLIPWEEEMAKDAATQTAAPTASAERPFFSIAKGILKFDGNKVPNNETDVVILDYAYVNAYFAEAYKEGEAQTPACFAVGREKDELAPEAADVEEKQNDDCATCPNNEWGSKGDGSKAKACGNKVRLMMISAGDLKSADTIAKAQIAYLMVPPTSLKAFGSFIKEACNNASGQIVKPIFAVATKLSLEGFNLSFEEAKGYKIDRAIYTALKAKKDKMGDDGVLFGFPKMDDAPQKQTKAAPSTRRKKI